MENPKKPAENLGVVPINAGLASNGKHFGGDIINGKFTPHVTGELRREVDPTGKIVEHRVRKSVYVHERWHNISGPHKLADELYDAAEKFRIDFERGQLAGNYARLDLFKVRSGKQAESDNVSAAKMRVSDALSSIGRGKDGPSMSQSCAWNVVGLGLTLENWTDLIRQGGVRMNADKAAGILHSALERLALNYGMIDMGKMALIGQDKAYGRGIKDFHDYVSIFATTAQGGERGVIGRLIAGAAKRFQKFV